LVPAVRCSNFRRKVFEYTRLNIQAAKVMDLERPNRREAKPHAPANCRINVFHARDAPIDQIPHFAHHRHLDAIDQEAGQLLPDANRLFSATP
jgi:hypothetical protein